MNEIPSDDGVIGDENKNLIAQLHVELDPSKRITAEQQHEHSVAIYDILDENYFSLQEHEGPYCLYLRTDSRHIHFDVRDENDEPLTGFVMALGPFRRIIRDYFEVCETYYDAIRTKSPLRFKRLIWDDAPCIMKELNYSLADCRNTSTLIKRLQDGFLRSYA